jgi:pimeloyl-ACP methyl ester carboxylesterase
MPKWCESDSAACFRKEVWHVHGIKTVILTAGEGDPLMFWHGAGTFHGFDFALKWANRYKVMIPYHPGFGDSADDISMASMHDYVMHYVELFDQLKLDRVNLVAFSLGGFMAARFATQHADRLRRLVLVSPAGLDVPEHPIVDLLRVAPEEVLAHLVEDVNVLMPFLPTGHDEEFLMERYREISSVARVIHDRYYDPNLPKWLHRLRPPTMLLWGEKDRIIPAAQAPYWAKHMPDATIRIIPGAGHCVLEESPDAVKAVADFVA